MNCIPDSVASWDLAIDRSLRATWAFIVAAAKKPSDSTVNSTRYIIAIVAATPWRRRRRQSRDRRVLVGFMGASGGVRCDGQPARLVHGAAVVPDDDRHARGRHRAVVRLDAAELPGGDRLHGHGLRPAPVVRDRAAAA